MSNIYFTGEVLNGAPNIFTNLQYNCWYKKLNDPFFRYSLILNMAIFIFKIKLNGTFPRSGTIDQKTINQHGLFY